MFFYKPLVAYLCGFISDCLKKEEEKSVIVFGQPGAGNSATINNVIKELSFEHAEE